MSVFGLGISYSVRGQDDELAVQKMAVAFERAGEEFTAANFGERVFPKLIPVFEKELKEQFAAEGEGPNRGAWKALSPGYAAWKERVYPGQPKLVATGRMREALTSEGSPFAMRVYSGAQFNFGTQGVEYASFHQTGAGKMPDRPLFDFDVAFERAVQQTALTAAREAIKDSGLGEFADVTE